LSHRPTSLESGVDIFLKDLTAIRESALFLFKFRAKAGGNPVEKLVPTGNKLII
jgi:hypothetical protein